MSYPSSNLTSSPGANKHIVGLDLLRFIAALGVLFIHLAYSASVWPGSPAYQLLHGLVSYPELASVANFGWLGVEIFFVISGFVIAFSAEKSTLFSFVRSRALRLLPAAWVCATITYAVGYWFLPESQSLTAYRHSILFMPWAPWVDPSYWTLGVEIAFYSMVAILIGIGQFKQIDKLALVIGSVSAIFWIFYFATFTQVGGHLHDLLSTSNQSYYLVRIQELLLIKHGCFFAVGVFLWLHLVKGRARPNLFVITLLLAGCVLQIVAHNAADAEKTGLIHSAIPPIVMWLLSIAFMVFAVKRNDIFYKHAWVTAVLRRVGLMTYPLYLVHQIVGAVLMKQMLLNGANAYTALITSILLVVALSAFISIVLERPFKALIAKLFYQADRVRSNLVPSSK